MLSQPCKSLETGSDTVSEHVITLFETRLHNAFMMCEYSMIIKQHNHIYLDVISESEN